MSMYMQPCLCTSCPEPVYALACSISDLREQQRRRRRRRRQQTTPSLPRDSCLCPLAGLSSRHILAAQPRQPNRHPASALAHRAPWPRGKPAAPPIPPPPPPPSVSCPVVDSCLCPLPVSVLSPSRPLACAPPSHHHHRRRRLGPAPRRPDRPPARRAGTRGLRRAMPACTWGDGTARHGRRRGCVLRCAAPCCAVLHPQGPRARTHTWHVMHGWHVTHHGLRHHGICRRPPRDRTQDAARCSLLAAPSSHMARPARPPCRHARLQPRSPKSRAPCRSVTRQPVTPSFPRPAGLLVPCHSLPCRPSRCTHSVARSRPPACMHRIVRHRPAYRHTLPLLSPRLASPPPPPLRAATSVHPPASAHEPPLVEMAFRSQVRGHGCTTGENLLTMLGRAGRTVAPARDASQQGLWTCTGTAQIRKRGCGP